jgi:hyperosmotically inducible protein
MTPIKKYPFLTLFVAAGLAAPGIGMAQNADNTKVNARARSIEALTAEEQGQTKLDLKLTQDIRRAIVDHEALSMYADNVKIITMAGIVTLKGPVNTAEERSIIAEIATNIAGANKVRNEIDVVSKS